MAVPLCLSLVMNNKWNLIFQKRCYPKKLSCRSYVGRYWHCNAIAETFLYNTRTPHINNVYFPVISVLVDQSVRLPAQSEIVHSIYKTDRSISDGVLFKGAVTRNGIEPNKKPFHHIQMRWNSGWNPRGLPRLMDFPEIVWPSVFKTLKNRVLASLIITPYFDKEFSLSEFVFGSKQAVELVSDCLANGDCQSLNGLLTEDALKEVKKNIALFSESQRRELKVTKEDIYFAFPYQIGVMFNDDNENTQKRFVEITMVYHVLRGLKEMREKDITPPLNLGVIPEYQEKLQLLNYRFIREFTKGTEGDWSVNILNHFKPADRPG